MWEKLKVSWRGRCVLLALFLAAISLGLLFDRIFFAHGMSTCASDFSFINPLLDCNLSEKKAESLNSLDSALRDNIAKYQKQGNASRVSVFVRDLRSSRFVGINENEMFFMASLLKLPVLIGGYKLAEVEPKILDQEIPYTGAPDLYREQYVQPLEMLEVGKSYTVRDLMKRAVVYSDNTAAQILFDYYPPEFLDRIIQALGIEFVRPEGTKENLVTARTYAGIFRSLYKASYLTREYANEALSVLTETVYDDGATAKLPKETLVAHKFGERSFPNPSDSSKFTRQLHECGLVYAKDGAEPYTFCIMTEGTEYAELQKILQDLSLEIYNAMSKD
jgi:beta-lactamase class A